MRHLPNLITLLRVLLVPPIGWAIVSRQFPLALALAAAAGLSDAIDGFLARHFDWQSRLGAWLDPAADKLMLVTAYASLGWIGAVPWWLVALVVSRDLVIVVGAAAWRHWRGPLEVKPRLLSKCNTTMQILYVLAVLLVHAGLIELALEPLVIVVAAVTVASGADYVWHYARRNQWGQSH